MLKPDNFMGRIKTTLVKRTATKLMNEEGFDSSFEDNKKFIAGTMPSKRIRNMVAGYITKKTKEKRKANTPKQEIN